MFELERIADQHDQATVRWHDDAAAASQSSFTDHQGKAADLHRLVLVQHRANFDLWHEEDAARDPLATDATIAGVKRRIDALNQQRNNLVEEVDELLLQHAGEQAQGAPLHSETPGLIIDRLSILSLKKFHTAEAALRPGATDAHRREAEGRLITLAAQQADLSRCLEELWSAVRTGQRRFKLYRQLKMYNDPAWNPVLYRYNMDRSLQER